MNVWLNDKIKSDIIYEDKEKKKLHKIIDITRINKYGNCDIYIDNKFFYLKTYRTNEYYLNNLFNNIIKYVEKNDMRLKINSLDDYILKNDNKKSFYKFVYEKLLK